MYQKNFIDLLLSLPVFHLGRMLKKIRARGIENFPHTRRALMKAGIFPIRDHYYEPLIAVDRLSQHGFKNRELTGLKLNVEHQLEFLRNMAYGNELASFPREKSGEGFYLHNKNYEAGDADIWYSVVRAMKPRRIFEIGSGFSTLLALAAVEANRREDPGYQCEHVCVEPYEMPWLEKTSARVLRQKIEDVPVDFFKNLQQGDILFIDSSHMVRPQGDVLRIYLEILPVIHTGVLVHIHDIFTPNDYPRQWIVEEMRFWNEQYLLEAILSNSPCWQVTAALNFLKHNHFKVLKECCHFLTESSEPGSFYMTKI